MRCTVQSWGLGFQNAQEAVFVDIVSKDRRIDNFERRAGHYANLRSKCDDK